MARLDQLPPELLGMITDHLEPIAHLALRMTSKTTLTLTRRSPILSKAAWVAFNHAFEKGARRRPVRLICTLCSKILSHDSFSDSQAQKGLHFRFCIACGLLSQKYCRGSFKIGKVQCFACPGCRKGVMVEKEAVYGSLTTKKSRWCRDCWGPVSAFIIAERKGRLYLSNDKCQAFANLDSVPHQEDRLEWKTRLENFEPLWSESWWVKLTEVVCKVLDK